MSDPHLPDDEKPKPKRTFLKVFLVVVGILLLVLVGIVAAIFAFFYLICGKH